MRVGLLDVDSKLPNLALMKLCRFHREAGDTVEHYSPLWLSTYDRVYASRVFDFSDTSHLIPDRMVIGGTGWDVASALPAEIERLPPDYSLYDYPHSIGFTSRGCRFQCKFCVVPQKEGRPRPVATIGDIWIQRESDLVVLFDNDFFGNPEWRDRVAELLDLNLRVNFSQGLNIRTITDEQARALKQVRFRTLSGKRDQVSFAWDRIRDEKLVNDGIDRILGAGISPRQMAFFILVGFDTTPEQDLYRIERLRDLGMNPFVMPHDRSDPYQRTLARWVNHKAVFKSVSWREYRHAHGPVTASQT